MSSPTTTPADGSPRRAASARSDMFPAQRHARIIEAVRSQGAASIQSLADALNVSASTIRRDLEYLTEVGHLQRTHGGAIMRGLPTARFELEPTIAAETALTQKSAIAAIAAERVSPGQSVIFDASSTVRMTAEAIVARAIAITGVTNDLRCAVALMPARHVQAITTGGMVHPGTGTLVGEPGQSFLRGIHVDVAFIGVHTVSGRVLTETSLEVAAMKRLMIQAARRVIVLADSSKFGPPSFCEICDVASVHEVVTDDGAPEALVADLRRAGVAVTLAIADGGT